MSNNPRFGALSSSVNPQELAASVQGGITAVAALIVLVLGMFGVPVAEAEITQIAAQAGTAVGAIWALFGLVRKIVVRFSQR